MAIYHLHVNMISRKSGRSAVAASAYRAGEKIKNDCDGITYDYTRKSGVIHTEIMLPENAPREYAVRAVLWNAIEKSEKRIDSQTAREIDIALPVEFNLQEQIEVARAYIQENFVSVGMCADFAIHDKSEGNPHAHIMLTTRDVTEQGFGGKNREWNNKAYLEKWRENWADICNERFKSKGLPDRIDHRTLEAQGIDREPTTHIGVKAQAMERAGRNSDRMSEFREINERNTAQKPEVVAEYMHEIKQGYMILDNEINGIKQQTAEIRREMQRLKFRAEDITERAEEIQGMGRNRERAESYFKRQFYISPEESSAEVKRLEYKFKDLQRVHERLQCRLAPLEDERAVFAVEYQRQRLLAEINPNGRNILDKLTELDKQSRGQSQSVKGNIAVMHGERMLSIVTERNFQEILKDVQPEQARELVKLREREKVRELSREFNQNRL